jgi:hypothetical protein
MVPVRITMKNSMCVYVDVDVDVLVRVHRYYIHRSLQVDDYWTGNY